MAFRASPTSGALPEASRATRWWMQKEPKTDEVQWDQVVGALLVGASKPDAGANAAELPGYANDLRLHR